MEEAAGASPIKIVIHLHRDNKLVRYTTGLSEAAVCVALGECCKPLSRNLLGVPGTLQSLNWSEFVRLFL